MSGNKMDLSTDRDFLTGTAYANQQRLETRIRTHRLYSQPKINFHDWVLGHIDWQGDEWVLDIGCGSGGYLQPVSSRLTAGGRLFAADLSTGMLNDIRHRDIPSNTSLLNGNAMQLPFADGSLDVVMANHMLYHVPNIPAALQAIRRVMKPGATFIAVTNARESMQRFKTEVLNSLAHFGITNAALPMLPVRKHFPLESGADILEPVFPGVKKYVLDSYLVFPSAAPVIDYIDSFYSEYAGLASSLDWGLVRNQVARQIEAEIEREGEYRVSKQSGVFVMIR